MIHRLACRILVGPFVWANQRQQQNIITRTIRAAWRAL